MMVVGVIALDALAVGVYYLAGVRRAAPELRTAFTVVWTLATLVIVGVGLRRIRRARHGR
jgi:hypothetical protein